MEKFTSETFQSTKDLLKKTVELRDARGQVMMVDGTAKNMIKIAKIGDPSELRKEFTEDISKKQKAYMKDLEKMEKDFQEVTKTHEALMKKKREAVKNFRRMKREYEAAQLNVLKMKRFSNKS